MHAARVWLWVWLWAWLWVWLWAWLSFAHVSVLRSSKRIVGFSNMTNGETFWCESGYTRLLLITRHSGTRMMS